MHIHHIALWTTRLEELKDFYITYFKGTGNEKYINPLKGFESYLVSFVENIDKFSRVVSVLVAERFHLFDHRTC